MKINEVEALVGITKKNIRFYEEKGLLSPRRNSENGYRDYGGAEVEALKRIKLMRKLGVPIEDIRRMQEGEQTVGDGMRRHLVTLERERKNIDEAVRLCTLLQQRQERLSELDADQALAEMEQLEHAGATFQNKQRQDIRVRYVAPVVISVLLVVLMAVVIGLLFWAVSLDTADAPPPPLLLPLLLVMTFTMYFSGGMIPAFLVVKLLGLYNTFWALVIPGAISTYNMIVMRSFFESSIPEELHDAANIDGCDDYQYLLKILLPLSKPVLAVMVLFYGTGHWNAFFNAIIYLRNAADYPLQVVLRNILLKNVLSENMITDFGGAATYSHTAEIIKYGLIIVSSIPMLAVYPFVQKHFVKGVMIGSIKG